MEQKHKVITINPHLMTIAEALAEQNEMSLSEWINYAIEKQAHLEQKEYVYQMYLHGEL